MNPTGATETDCEPAHSMLRWQTDADRRHAVVFLRAATDHSLRRTLTERYQLPSPVSLAELAARLTGLPAADADETPSTARIMLAHSHLPRLAEASLIDDTASTDRIKHISHGRTVLEASIRTSYPHLPGRITSSQP